MAKVGIRKSKRRLSAKESAYLRKFERLEAVIEKMAKAAGTTPHQIMYEIATGVRPHITEAELRK